VLLEQIIDYAGLFAPASLDMVTSVNNYSRYLAGPQRWALGRFVIPAARLEEFLNAQENVAADPWRLSAIISANVEAELAAVVEFNRKAPGAVIDSVEVRVSGVEEISLVRKNHPEGTTIFFEIAPELADALLPMLEGIDDECAKLRSGGVVEAAFPAVVQLANFVARSAELAVPFKATAGLHHPLRCVRALTYEPDSTKGTMHGFLNLFTASAIAWSAAHADVGVLRDAPRDASNKVPREILATCIADQECTHWHFDDHALTWTGGDEPMRFDLECLRSMRSKFALSFGSCSFEEPIAELREFGLL
jgi:hypothetical protein